MNVRQILHDLDKHAQEFNFPVLDNAYVEFAAARLTAFRDEKDWLIVFEVLGFSNREVQFVDDLYAYGSCVTKEGLVGEDIPLTPVPESALFDTETNECIADWSHWRVNVRGTDMSFSPTREEYAAAGVVVPHDAGPCTLNEINLLRFLVHRVGEALFLPDHLLLDQFPKCAHLPKFIQTTHWQHPDIADEEAPSDNKSLRSLVEGMAERDPERFMPGQSNTDWRLWVEAM